MFSFLTYIRKKKKGQRKRALQFSGWRVWSLNNKRATRPRNWQGSSVACCLSSPSPEQPGILVYHGCPLNSPLPPLKSNGLLAISSKYLIPGVALIQQGDLLPSLKPALVTAGSWKKGKHGSGKYTSGQDAAGGDHSGYHGAEYPSCWRSLSEERSLIRPDAHTILLVRQYWR